MSEGTRKAIEEIEAKMAEVKSQIDAKAAELAPHRSKLDELLAKEQELRGAINLATEALNAARGDVGAWLELKRKFGQLAASRMQLRTVLGALLN